MIGEGGSNEVLIQDNDREGHLHALGRGWSTNPHLRLKLTQVDLLSDAAKGGQKVKSVKFGQAESSCPN